LILFFSRSRIDPVFQQKQDLSCFSAEAELILYFSSSKIDPVFSSSRIDPVSQQKQD